MVLHRFDSIHAASLSFKICRARMIRPRTEDSGIPSTSAIRREFSLCSEKSTSGCRESSGSGAINCRNFCTCWRSIACRSASGSLVAGSSFRYVQRLRLALAVDGDTKCNRRQPGA